MILLTVCSRQAPQSVGSSRQECWSGLPFPSPGIFLTQGLWVGSLLSEPRGNPREALGGHSWPAPAKGPCVCLTCPQLKGNWISSLVGCSCQFLPSSKRKRGTGMDFTGQQPQGRADSPFSQSCSVNQSLLFLYPESRIFYPSNIEVAFPSQDLKNTVALYTDTERPMPSNKLKI